MYKFWKEIPQIDGLAQRSLLRQPASSCSERSPILSIQKMKLQVTAVLALLLISLAQGQRRRERCRVNHVCFALDQSGSIKGIYPQIQSFTVQTAQGINALTSAVYSAVGFSDAFSVISAPTSNVGTFVSAVNIPVTPDGGTNMYAGVNQCYRYVENKPGKRVIVIVTDGLDNGVPTAETLINSKSATGVAIIAVGIGNGIDANYLQRISDLYVPVSTDAMGAVSNVLRKGICTVPVNGNTCAAAARLCDFRFKNVQGVPTYSIAGKPDQVFTGEIVSKSGPRIGILNTNGIIPEFINTDGTVTLINTVGSPRLTPTHFKPLPFPKSVGSGIGHQTFTGNQFAVSRRRCVRVFFTTFQVLSSGRKPRVINNVNVDREDNKCVVFRTF